MSRFGWLAGILLIASQGTLAALPIQAGGQPAPAQAGGAGYTLAPDDQIQVTLYGQPPTTVQTRIKADGSIVMPFLGTVQASGKTTDQLGDFIAQGLKQGGFFTRPQVNVEITGYTSKVVTVLGHVGSPGVYPLDRPQSVAMMVARAGGIRNEGANAVILSHEGQSSGARIPLTDPSQQAGANMMLQPGDTLVIPAVEQVYVYGEVKSPGTFPLRPGMTYRQAVASAGGPTLAGKTSNFEVHRGDEKIKHLSLDDKVQPEDVIFIKERFF